MNQKQFQPIPEPVFLTPSDLPSLEFLDSNKERKEDGIKKTNVVKTDNFGLLLSRFIPYQVIRNDDKDKDRIVEIVKNKKTGRDEDKTYITLRNFWFEHLPNNFTSANTELKSLIFNTHQRWLATTEGAERFTMVSRSRLIVGLGGKGALDFGITLHPVTGLPYIPGSALKGLCRNYELLKIAKKKDISPLPPDDPKQKSELEKLDEKLTDEQNMDADAIIYRQIFGTQEKAGECIFFDAILSPLGEEHQRIFETDVMTPHFRKYYESSGKQPPDDADSPNPIVFVTVPAETTFSFAIGLRHGATSDKRQDIIEVLKKALEELGIGAKTAAGYGVFDSKSFKPIKTKLEVGDEIRGKVGGDLDIDYIGFTPTHVKIADKWYELEKLGITTKYSAFIPVKRIIQNRQKGQTVIGRIVKIEKDIERTEMELICEQVIND